MCDSKRQSFTLLPRKKEKFLKLVREVLSKETVEVVALQKLSGKCISMALAVPGARMYINEINLAIGRAIRYSLLARVPRNCLLL